MCVISLFHILFFFLPQSLSLSFSSHACSRMETLTLISRTAFSFITFDTRSIFPFAHGHSSHWKCVIISSFDDNSLPLSRSLLDAWISFRVCIMNKVSCVRGRQFSQLFTRFSFQFQCYVYATVCTNPLYKPFEKFEKAFRTHFI